MRRWPSESDTRHLDFIHFVLRLVYRNGFHLVPVPISTIANQSYVLSREGSWELAEWMPGQANYQSNPNTRKLGAAATALAKFHTASHTLEKKGTDPFFLRGYFKSGTSRSRSGTPAKEATSFSVPARHTEPTGYGLETSAGVSGGITARLDQLIRWTDDGAQQIRELVDGGGWPELADRAKRLLAMFARLAPETRSLLDDARQRVVPIGPCLRDVHRDHVLFIDDEVSGLIDFGAVKNETVAADIARLLGSLVLDDRQGWQTGLAAYQDVRPLAAAEVELITVFDRSNVALSGMNWLEWIYVEGRRFDDRPAILARIDEIMRRMERLAAPG